MNSSNQKFRENLKKKQLLKWKKKKKEEKRYLQRGRDMVN